MSDGSDDTTEIFITLSLRIIIPNPATDAAVGWVFSLAYYHCRTFTRHAALVIRSHFKS